MRWPCSVTELRKKSAQALPGPARCRSAPHTHPAAARPPHGRSLPQSPAHAQHIFLNIPKTHDIPSLARRLWFVQVYQPSYGRTVQWPMNIGCGPGPVGWSCTHSRSRVLAPTSSPKASLSALLEPCILPSCRRIQDSEDVRREGAAKRRGRALIG